jgi:hypothetical protein
MQNGDLSWMCVSERPMNLLSARWVGGWVVGGGVQQKIDCSPVPAPLSIIWNPFTCGFFLLVSTTLR